MPSSINDKSPSTTDYPARARSLAARAEALAAEIGALHINMKAAVLLNLGREDQLDRDGLRRLVASINRYLGEPDAGLPPADAAQLAGEGLTVTGSRPVDTVHVAMVKRRAHDEIPAPRRCFRADP